MSPGPGSIAELDHCRCTDRPQAQRHARHDVAHAALSDAAPDDCSGVFAKVPPRAARFAPLGYPSCALLLLLLLLIPVCSHCTQNISLRHWVREPHHGHMSQDAQVAGCSSAKRPMAQCISPSCVSSCDMGTVLARTANNLPAHATAGPLHRPLHSCGAEVTQHAMAAQGAPALVSLSVAPNKQVQLSTCQHASARVRAWQRSQAEQRMQHGADAAAPAAVVSCADCGSTGSPPGPPQDTLQQLRGMCDAVQCHSSHEVG